MFNYSEKNFFSALKADYNGKKNEFNGSEFYENFINYLYDSRIYVLKNRYENEYIYASILALCYDAFVKACKQTDLSYLYYLKDNLIPDFNDVELGKDYYTFKNGYIYSNLFDENKIRSINADLVINFTDNLFEVLNYYEANDLISNDEKIEIIAYITNSIFYGILFNFGDKQMSIGNFFEIQNSEKFNQYRSNKEVDKFLKMSDEEKLKYLTSLKLDVEDYLDNHTFESYTGSIFIEQFSKYIYGYIDEPENTVNLIITLQ